MRIRSLIAAPILALFTAATVTSLAAPTASAASAPSQVSHQQLDRRGNNWGAISIATDGAYGYSYDYPTKAGAVSRAVNGCKAKSHYDSTCNANSHDVHAVFANQCGAIWYTFNSSGYVNRAHYGFSVYKNVAKNRARNGHSGGHVVTVCTTRRA